VCSKSTYLGLVALYRFTDLFLLADILISSRLVVGIVDPHPNTMIENKREYRKECINKIKVANIVKCP
jgi:hypothetical protein